MDSGLIFAIVVALWLACLIPDWIRRREQLSSSRARDRFSGAMRVLTRRRPGTGLARVTAGPVYVLSPPVPEVSAFGGALPPRPKGLPFDEEPDAGGPAGTGRRARGRRPRRWGGLRTPALVPVVLASILVLAVVATPVLAALAYLRVIPGSAALTSLTLGVGALAVLRWTAVLRARADARRRRVVAQTPAPRRPVDAVVVAPSSVDPTEPQDSDDDSDDVHRSSPQDPDGTWTPVPVPPPTYLLKAAAPPRPEPRPAPCAAAATQPVEKGTAVPLLPDLDVVLERRRAAGE